MASMGGAEGEGLATITGDGRILDTWFPVRRLCEPDRPSGTTRINLSEAATSFGSNAPQLVRTDAIRGVHVVAVRTTIADLQSPPLESLLRDCWRRGDGRVGKVQK